MEKYLKIIKCVVWTLLALILIVVLAWFVWRWIEMNVYAPMFMDTLFDKLYDMVPR